MTDSSRLKRRELLGGGIAAAGLALGACESAQHRKTAGSPKARIGMNLLLWTSTPNEEHFALLDDVKRWGFDGAEFPMFVVEGDHWKKLGQHCNELGLGRTVSTAMPEDGNPVSEDPKIRQGAVDFLKRCVDRSHELGATVLCGPLYSPVGRLVGRGREEWEFNYAVEVLREASEYAQQANIILAHEPLNRFETYVINSQEDGCKLVDAVGMPNFGLHYDTFHANIEEKNVNDVIRFAGSRIKHVHLSENDRSTPGMGQVHWDENFAALKAIGYDQWLTIEAFGKALPEVAAATCIWRRMYETEEQLARDGVAFVKKSWSA
jgi:D-psicose/D-tagatose/L-ribulose 3-epimerase